MFVPPGYRSAGAEVTETCSAGQEAPKPSSIVTNGVPESFRVFRIHLRGGGRGWCSCLCMRAPTACA